MSGGHFDYQQYRLNDPADQVRDIVNHREEYAYSERTFDKIEGCAAMLKVSAIALHRIDWLVSGDDSEETFHIRLLEDLEKFND